MFWSRRGSVFGTVRFRVMVWYGVLFSAFAGILFLCEDRLLRSQLLSRTDAELRSDARQFEALYEQFGLRVLEDEFQREAEANGVDNVLLLLRSPNFTVLAQSDLSLWDGLDLSAPSTFELDPGESRFHSLRIPETRQTIRVLNVRTQDGNVLQIGRSLAANHVLLRGYRRVFAIVVLAMLAFGVALGWGVTGRAMSGVKRVTQIARRIGNADLATRVCSSNEGREIRDLTAAFNQMLDRIDRLVRGMREVTDNIAHDLRSPLTRIRAAAEAELTRAGRAASATETAGVVVEECDRLNQMIDVMLEIAEMNAGVVASEQGDVNLSELARDVQDLFGPVAEDQGVELRLEPPGGALCVSGDVRRLQRVLANLVDNAIKFTPPGGQVDIGALIADGEARLVVRDTGVGISPADQTRVFDRFFRADSSRSMAGNGLGLALARAIVEAHDGRIELRSTLGGGSEFTVCLPASAVPGR